MVSYFRFDTATAAQNAKRLLQNAGIPARIRRDPQPDRRRGCGFALYVPQQTDAAKQLLRQNGWLREDHPAP